MKVNQISVGKFHHFDLAKQLNKRGILQDFYTGYPSFKLRGEGLPIQKVKTFPWLMTPRMALAKLGLMPSWAEQPIHRLAQETLDAYAATIMSESDVLFALSGSGLRAGRLAQQRGGHYVCDRGSSHIRYQNHILKEEYTRMGRQFNGIDYKTIKREEAEYEAADLITVPSDFVYRSFVEMGVPVAKLRKIPYGVDLTRFTKVGEPPKDLFNVLFVGQVCFRKGIPDLLQAFSLFDHPAKRLRIVGSVSNEIRSYLDEVKQQDNVEFLGHVAQPQLKKIMSCSHVMVLPSIEEGLALVQAQAMACGCPVVGTTHTGAEDLFTDGVEGFIVPPRNSVAIAACLQQLADDPDKRQAMSEAALRNTQMREGWDRYGDLMVKTLYDLINQK